MDEGTNFLSVKKGYIIFDTNFFLFFKANCEECPSPPPSKRARANNAAPAKATVIQYGRWPKPPKHVLPDQAAAQSAQDCDIDGPSTSRKFKSEWAASYTMASPAPGKVDAPRTQGPPMVQHASPGLSGTQMQPEFANVSIFPTYLIEIYIYFFQCLFSLFFSLIFNTV